MKKFLLIGLLIVGHIYSQNDKLILKDGKSHNIKYHHFEDEETVRVTIYHGDYKLEGTYLNLNKIESLILENGSVIINDGNLILDAINSDVREIIIKKDNINQSSKLIKASGYRLKKFKEQWATAYLMRSIGLGLIQMGATQDDGIMFIYLGGGLGFMGVIIDLLSYNQIDKAGDALIAASKELEKEQSEQDTSN